MPDKAWLMTASNIKRRNSSELHNMIPGPEGRVCRPVIADGGIHHPSCRDKRQDMDAVDQPGEIPLTSALTFRGNKSCSRNWSA